MPPTCDAFPTVMITHDVDEAIYLADRSRTFTQPRTPPPTPENPS